MKDLIVIVILLFVCVSLFILAHMSKKYNWYEKAKARQEELDRKYKAQEPEPFQESVPNFFDYLEFHVAGVTFNNEKTSRQSILRKMYFKDPPFDKGISIEFEQYEYEGKPAVYVYANDEIIGNIPAKYVDKFIEISSRQLYIGYKVIGGYDGKSFGCLIKIKWD